MGCGQSKTKRLKGCKTNYKVTRAPETTTTDLINERSDPDGQDAEDNVHGEGKNTATDHKPDVSSNAESKDNMLTKGLQSLDLSTNSDRRQILPVNMLRK